MKKLLGCLAIGVLIASCGGRKMSPEELQHKLDSVQALEVKERLKLQGIDVESSDNPLKLFYDSLEIQPLPISYSGDYVSYLPSYKPLTPDLASYLELINCKHPKAISLPESVGTKLIIVATDEYDGIYSLWLYSLDDDFLPVDKLCLYASEDKLTDEDPLAEERFIQYFSITSDYEIRLLDYSKEKYQAKLEEVYHIDESRKFLLSSSKEE